MTYAETNRTLSEVDAALSGLRMSLMVNSMRRRGIVYPDGLDVGGITPEQIDAAALRAFKLNNDCRCGYCSARLMESDRTCKNCGAAR